MQYELVFSSQFKEDCAYWKRTQPRFGRKITGLLQSICVNPRSGIGKPERLKYFDGEERWSRRISPEHRLVYKIKGNSIHFVYARYHYR